uniref:TSA: Wollemia nobilis Ref_Wollemi_Transcript_12757_5054 transcribed RNA sequence n=1 Tax=Wollemia nobilis TaxID=56998 RepID=A0A0C9RL63_9CONI
MAWDVLKGTVSWFHGYTFPCGDHCSNEWDLQRATIRWSRTFSQHLFTTTSNLLFMLIFLVALLISHRNHSPYVIYNKSVLHTITALLTLFIGITNLGVGLWTILASSTNKKHEAVLYCIQALTCAVLAISLKINLKKPPTIVAITWWIIEFVLGTFLVSISIAKIFETRTFSMDIILDMTTWATCFLLVYCSIRAIRHWTSFKTIDLTKPLLKGMTLDETKVTPLNKAGILSRMTFRWIDSLLRLGYSKTLELKDIPHLVPEDEARTAEQAFAEAWELQKKHDPLSRPTIFRTLSKCYWKDMVVTGIFAFLRSVAMISGPLFLRSFVQYAGGKRSFKYEGFILVGGLCVVKIIESLSQRHWYFNSKRVGMKMRSALMAALYQKQLRLSSLGRQRHATGEIVNYIAVDAYRFGEFPWWLHWGWTVPFQMLVAINILFATVGWATVPGLLIIILTVILNNPLAKSLQKCQSEFMAAQDERLRATSEILNSMKIIKLQAWEDKFKEKIENLRGSEFKWLSSAQINRTYGTILYWMSPIIVASIVFAACAIIGNPPLTATTVFTVLATFRIMQEPVRMLPDVLAILIQVKVSSDRLNKFLQDDELKPDAITRKSLDGSAYTIKIHLGIFSWDPESSNTTLKGINLEIKKGEKVAVCGSVGSGKSALLCTILGEIPKVSGVVQVYGSIAYVAQTAWVQSGTVRDNILYGKPMDKVQYEKAIRVCALDKDIENFVHGDMTEIGERGLNMSGGQKQRIQLARAVYNDADIYLLDDPFSAVDAHTAASLFNDCVMGALAKKTVVLVTHQVEFLPAVDTILVMKDGEIKQAGSYDQILAAGETFKQLVNAHKEAMISVDPVNNVSPIEAQVADINSLELPRMQSSSGLSVEEIGDIPFNTMQLTVEEEKEMGDSGLGLYLDYIRTAGGALLSVFIAFSQGAFVVGQVAANYWLASALLDPSIDSGLLVGIYAGISLLSGAFVYLRARLVVVLGLRASKAFFSGMFGSIFKAPMAFFDTTPVGRILIRASSDLSLIDLDLAWAFSYVLSSGADLLGMVFIISFVTWQVLVVAVPVFFITRWIQMYYLPSARELLRINGTTKAPVMNNTAETALGVVTIRAFKMTEIFKEKNLNLIDRDASLFFHTIAAMEWLILRLETLGNIVLFTSAFLLVSLPARSISPGFAGLALSYALSLTSCQVFFCAMAMQSFQLHCFCGAYKAIYELAIRTTGNHRNQQASCLMAKRRQNTVGKLEDKIPSKCSPCVERH